MRCWIRRVPKPHERGAVLLTVLLLVTFVSVVAVSIMDDIRFGILRTANTRLIEQAHWYAFGAEELAKVAITESWRQDPGRSTLNDVWARGPSTFPVGGGFIEGAIADGSNCFNLNSLVEAEGDRHFVRSARGSAQYQNLLRLIGFTDGDAASLTNTVTDWIDSDTVPGTGGAEDAYYLALSPAYRTANTMIAQVSELRAMRGYDEDVYQRVRPYVCARRTNEPSTLNINTLTLEQAQLLVMLVGTDLEPQAARQVITDRPQDGFQGQQDFWSHRSFAGIDISSEVKDQVSVRSRYFTVRSEVVLAQAYVALESVFEQTVGGEVSLVSRQFGAVP